jgi:CRISPR system Cascade subunit CasC
MQRFLQLHFLTSYPPANLNRDDLSRPKTAVLGNVQRLRISSQCLKRTWRTSEAFAEALAGHLGLRTKMLGILVFEALGAGKTLADALAGKPGGGLPALPEALAGAAAQKIAGVFGKLKTAGEAKETKRQREAGLTIEQLAHLSTEELTSVGALVEVLRAGKREPAEAELKLLRETTKAVDIAMFGRMLADEPGFNVDATVQVAHAVTVHKVAAETDYFTAVDDLNVRQEDLGAAHVGELGFGAGLFYHYVCVNRRQLAETLGDPELARRGLAALITAALTTSPSGKQNSFGSRAYASFVLAEKGEAQPRSLHAAFLAPVSGEDVLGTAVERLTSACRRMDEVYGPCAEARYTLNAVAGEGSLRALAAFAAE